MVLTQACTVYGYRAYISNKANQTWQHQHGRREKGKQLRLEIKGQVDKLSPALTPG